MSGKAILEWLRVDRFELDEATKFAEDFFKNFGIGETGYFLKVDIKYLEQFGLSHYEFLFLLEKIKTSKCGKPKQNLYKKENCVVHKFTARFE